MESLQQLLVLQGLEKEKQKLEDELNELPQLPELRQLKKHIEQFQNDSKSQEDVLPKIDKSIRLLEIETESLTGKQRDFSENLYGGKLTNVKEMEATSEKIDEIKQKIKDKEDEIIDLMTAREKTEKELTDKKNTLGSYKTAFIKLHKEYKEKQQKNSSDLQMINEKIIKLTNQIDKDLLKLYNDLHAKFGPTVVATVEKNICSGCHMSISLELRKTLKDNGQMQRCDKCGRLLVYKN